jgi:hypothetical protein
MAEAPLGPGETGKEIGEHARHHGAQGASRHDRVMSLVEAGLLALVALLAAWSGFAAAKWSTESRLTIAAASTIRNEANTAELEGLDVRIGDALVFNAWLGAHVLGDPAHEQIAERRFRPALRVAFDAWVATDPDHNPDAPPGPQAMPQYVEPDVAKSKRLTAKAEALSERGSHEGETGDDYVRVTVYLATVLFLVGISTQFPVRIARYGLLVIGGVVLVYSIVELITLEKPPL